jgi:hypothetical protein
MSTSNYSFNTPTVGGSEDTWGTQLNANWTALDTLLGGANATEFAILDGATVTTAELNILDGVTASTAELNILDGVTASTAELNLLDGVTALTGADNVLVTGTAGASGQIAQWNADGDIVGTNATLDQSVWVAGVSTSEALISPAKLKAAASGSSSLATNGYQVLPSGLYIQWGRITGVSENVLKTVNFPIAFPNAVFSINLTPLDTRASNDFEVDLYSVAANPISTTQFQIMSEGTGYGSNKTVMFMAFGH